MRSRHRKARTARTAAAPIQTIATSRVETVRTSPNRSSMLIGAGAGDEAHSDETRSQRGVGEDAEQRVGGKLALAAQDQQQKGHRDSGGDGTQRQTEAEHEAKPHAQEAGMGERFAEIGHAPPDDEAADGTRHQRHAEPRKEGAAEEGFETGCRAWRIQWRMMRAVVIMAIHDRGRGGGCRRRSSAPPTVRRAWRIPDPAAPSRARPRSRHGH